MEVAALGLRIDGAEGVEKASGALDRLTKASESAEKSASRLAKEAGKGKRSVDDLGEAGERSAKRMSALGAAAIKAGAFLAAALSVNALRNYADAWSDMQSVVGASIGDMGRAGDMMTRLVDIANASYSPLQQTIDVYSRNVSVLRDLGKTSAQAADFTESLNHMLVLTATRGERAASVQNTLAKAMAVGKLDAQGLETVLANGGEVAQALANQLKTSVNGLRAMASQGKITGQVIADGIIKPLDDVRTRAAEMPATMADAFTRIQTNVTEFVGKIDKASGASSAMAELILEFADGIRTAGNYILAFGAWAGPAFDLVGAALSAVGQYADIAVVALAGFYAPALLGGIAMLTQALAVGLVGAIKAVTAAMLANPIGFIAAALAAAGYAAYKFRDEIKQAIGIDVVEVIKTAANYVIGSFVAAYEDIKFVWNNFGDMMGAAVIGGVNIAIRAINQLIQAALSGINGLADALRSIGIDIGSIGQSAGIKEIANPYAERLAASIEERNRAVAAALSKDRLGALFGGFSLPETSQYDGGAGGGVPPVPPVGGANAQAAKQNAKAIDDLAQSLYLAGLNGEELAVAQAKLSLNQYATPEQVEQVEALARAVYQVQEAMSKRQKFGEGKEADKYILGDASPLSGGAFDNQLARYEAEAEAERERYQGQLDRLAEARELQIETNRSYDQLEEEARQQHADRMAQIDQAKTSVMLTNASRGFGALADLMRQSQGEQSGIYRAMFAASKAFAVADATMNAYTAITKAWNSNPFPANLAAVAATAPQVMALVSAVSGTGLSGMAHDGIDSVPQTGTWLLEKGERVTTAKTSARLDSVLERIDARQRGALTSTQASASQPSKGVTVNVIENPDRAGQTETRRNEHGDEEADVFVADIFGDGKRSQALRQAFGLQRVGR